MLKIKKPQSHISGSFYVGSLCRQPRQTPECCPLWPSYTVFKSPVGRQGLWKSKFTRLHDREAKKRVGSRGAETGIKARMPWFLMAVSQLREGREGCHSRAEKAATGEDFLEMPLPAPSAEVAACALLCFYSPHVLPHPHRVFRVCIIVYSPISSHGCWGKIGKETKGTENPRLGLDSSFPASPKSKAKPPPSYIGSWGSGPSSMRSTLWGCGDPCQVTCLNTWKEDCLFSSSSGKEMLGLTWWSAITFFAFWFFFFFF